MVNTQDIKCETCGHVFTLKLQVDGSEQCYECPIELVCPDCNNHISMRFSAKHGLTPIKYKCIAQGAVTQVGYSATLPVIKEMYYKDTPTSTTPLFSSALNIFMIFGGKNINNYKLVISRLMHGIIPYRDLLNETLPLIQKPNNTTAFLTKVAKYFDFRNYNIDENADSQAIFNELIKCVYRALRTEEYINNRTSYYKEIISYIKEADPVSLQTIISSSSIFYDIDEWLLKRAYPHIAEITSRIEAYLPAIFYSSIGSFTIPHTDNFNILTADYNQVCQDYAKGFENINKIIPFLVALHNMVRNGDCAHFNENGQEHYNALRTFEGTFGGKRKNEIENYPALKGYFEYIFDNHLRNAEGHNNVDYDVMTQTITFLNNNNPNSSYSERLIDVCLRVYLQLMIIIEITQIIWQMKKRIEVIY